MDAQNYLKGMLQRTAMFFSQEEIDKVTGTTFAIAGLGGVGAITAELLARWGVRRFRLLDMDRYESSNLNRQLFATSKTLNRFKVDVAADRIREINPYAEIEMKIPERVNNDNVLRFVDGAGILIQNADNPSAKLFYLASQKYKIPLVNGYATVTGGRVQVFDYRKSECRTMLDGLWEKMKHGGEKPLDRRSAEEVAEFDRQNVHPTAPSINYVTNMVGCLITGEAIKLITGKGRVITYPRYLSFDVFTPGMKIKNSVSPINIDNIRRVHSVVRSKLKGLKR